MISMTGYGEAKSRLDGAQISVVIKSVNGRFLDIRFHLPKEYAVLEATMKKLISATIRRGTVDIYIHRRGASKAQVNINHEMAARWVVAYKSLAQKLKIQVDTSTIMDRLSELPQIFEIREAEELGASEKLRALQNVKVALALCNKERTREGLSLKTHIVKLLGELNNVVKSMETMRLKINAEHELRLNEKFKKLGIEASVDPVRFSQELILFLDKCDIGEEIERLKEHIQMCEKLVKIKTEAGKKLDFYSQELLREVNTIGSKANYARLTELVVKAKGLIEGLKEQAQNIE